MCGLLALVVALLDQRVSRSPLRTVDSVIVLRKGAGVGANAASVTMRGLLALVVVLLALQWVSCSPARRAAPVFAPRMGAVEGAAAENHSLCASCWP